MFKHKLYWYEYLESESRRENDFIRSSYSEFLIKTKDCYHKRECLKCKKPFNSYFVPENVFCDSCQLIIGGGICINCNKMETYLMKCNTKTLKYDLCIICSKRQQHCLLISRLRKTWKKIKY